MKRVVVLVVGVMLAGMGTYGLCHASSKSMALNAIRTITADEAQQITSERFSCEDELARFNVSGHPLPFDITTGDLYTPDENTVSVDAGEDVHLCKRMDGTRLSIIAYREGAYRIYHIIVTGLPIVELTVLKKMEGSEPIPHEYANAELKIFDGLLSPQPLVIESLARVKIRGFSSQLYEKKSYQIKLVDSLYKPKPVYLSPLGLSMNSKFALNSLYEDESKIRDVFSLDLWDRISAADSKRNKDQSAHMTHVELFINSEYWGLYGFHEIVNEYSFYGGPSDGALLKINRYLEEHLEEGINQDIFEWARTETAYLAVPYNRLETDFSDFCSIIFYSNDEDFLELIEYFIDIENCIDYYLFTELLYAKDNAWKNMVLKTEKAGETLKFIILPWDCDQVCGLIWTGEPPYYVATDMKHVSALVYQGGVGLFQRLLTLNVGNFRNKASEKWQVYRGGIFSEEQLINHADTLFDLLEACGARAREAMRWPDSALSPDNGFVQSFVKERLLYLDEIFSTMGAGDQP